MLAALAFAACSDHGGRPAAQAPEAVTQTRYVAPDGDDTGPGSVDRPWQTIGRATVLRAGTTLVLRAGTYRLRDLRIEARGTATAPVVVKAWPGERPVLDGSWPEFHDAPATAWTVHDAGRGIFRSTAAFPEAGRVYGELTAAHGGYRLVPYAEYAPLAADREDYSDTLPYYCGPGVFWNPADAHIYVRLWPGRYPPRVGAPTVFDTDARRTPLVLFGSGALLTLTTGSTYVQLRGLTLRAAEQTLEIEGGCQNVVVADCDLRAGRYEVLTRSGLRNFVLDSLVVDGGFPPWVARSDVKRPSGRAPARFLQGSALQLEGDVDRVEIANCRLRGLFDGIDTNGRPSHWNVHDNTFTTIRDDAFELATHGFRVDFHHNRITLAAAGVSWNGSTAPPPLFRGTKYIRDNVIDTSTPQLYGRDDPDGALPASWRGPAGDGMATGRPFGSHDTAGLDGPDPWLVYRNTLVGGVDVDGEGLGIGYVFPPFDAATPHRVVDNILVQTGDQWLARLRHLDDGAQVLDGNVWFRSSAQPSTPLLYIQDSAGTTTALASLQQLLAASAWQTTRVHYAPGWEARGVEGDPGLRDDYQPSPTGAAAQPGVVDSSLAWPGSDDRQWRGALPPWR